MASFGRFAKSSCNFSKQSFASILKQGCSSSKSAFPSGASLSQPVKSLRCLSVQDCSFLKTSKKLNKAELRQIQKSISVMSLSSKASLCMALLDSVDCELTDGTEDSDDVCSQTGHKRTARRTKTI